MLETFDTWWLRPALLTKFTRRFAADFQARIALQHVQTSSQKLRAGTLDSKNGNLVQNNKMFIKCKRLCTGIMF